MDLINTLSELFRLMAAWDVSAIVLSICCFSFCKLKRVDPELDGPLELATQGGM